MALDLIESEKLTATDFKSAGKYDEKGQSKNPMEHLMKSQWKH
jgi:hypothetical protein